MGPGGFIQRALRHPAGPVAAIKLVIQNRRGQNRSQRQPAALRPDPAPRRSARTGASAPQPGGQHDQHPGQQKRQVRYLRAGHQRGRQQRITETGSGPGGCLRPQRKINGGEGGDNADPNRCPARPACTAKHRPSRKHPHPAPGGAGQRTPSRRNMLKTQPGSRRKAGALRRNSQRSV